MVEPTGHVSVNPVVLEPSLLMNASLLPDSPDWIGVITGCPGEAAVGKSPELVSPATTLFSVTSVARLVPMSVPDEPPRMLVEDEIPAVVAIRAKNASVPPPLMLGSGLLFRVPPD
jgi:hypothetical protein